MDPFAALGLPRRYDIDMDELETSYRELQKALHPDKHAGAGASQRKLSLEKAVAVNEAYRTLKDDLRRAEALLALFQASDPAHEPSSTQPQDAEFLLQVMVLREALDEAKDTHDRARVEALTEEVQGQRTATRAELVGVFAVLEGGTSQTRLAQAASLVGRLKFFDRFLEQVSATREEALD
jgi:molecular chaperone HscB